MTGVLEAIALGGAVHAWAQGADAKQKLEMKVVRELFARAFSRDITETASETVTCAANIRPGTNAGVSAAIRTIEQYQSERKGTILGIVTTSKDFAGDPRTLVCEELKRWLSSITGDSAASPKDVGIYLEFCRQLLMRPSVFESQNKVSFVSTIAKVSAHLDTLLEEALKNQRTCASALERILNTGLELMQISVPLLIFAIGEVPKTGSKVRGLEDLRRCPALEDAGDVMKLIQSLVSTPHVDVLLSGGSDSGNSSKSSSLETVLQELRGRWAQEYVRSSGLFQAFQGVEGKMVRLRFLDLVTQLDNLFYFTSMLKPYLHLTAVAGDVVACSLYESLGHLLQELEHTLAQVHQARLDVMRAAKQQLQAFARQASEGLQQDESSWMINLQYVDELGLDEVQHAISSLCMELRTLGSTTRLPTLKRDMLEAVKDMASSLASSEFRDRCALPVPENTLLEVQQLLGDTPSLSLMNGAR